jgi:hypothetical protein
MSAPKTKPTEVSVESHIAAIANEKQRNDAHTLVALMRKVTKQEPRMWGPSIVGFGSYHYKYASGHEGDSALTGFAARGRELVVYIAPGFEGRDVLLAKLGEHRTGKVCVYIRQRRSEGPGEVGSPIDSRYEASLSAAHLERRLTLSCTGLAFGKC